MPTARTPHPKILLVLGLPGAGKTTLGKEIAGTLAVPFISKDDIKTRLFDVYGWKDREASKQAGMASFRIMDYFIEEQIKNSNSIIVESTFNPEYDNTRFQAWQEKYDVRYVQLYCYAEPDILRKRFVERAATDNRHVSSVEGDEGLAVLENYIKLGFRPLGIKSKIVKIDTTDFSKVDVVTILKQINEDGPAPVKHPA